MMKEGRTTFIQWKGTDLCMDFCCPECEKREHFDGYFLYTITCPNCKTEFKLSDSIEITKVNKP